MKTLIIYVSVHHGNTEKIARAMAEVLDAKLVKLNEVNINELSEYDLIGFGSGIYFGKHNRSLLKFIDKLPVLKNKKAFIFATSAIANKPWHLLHGTTNFHNVLKRKLVARGFSIIGEFDCRGWSTYGWFKCIGGISKSRPNEKDLKKAENFARNLKNSGII